MRCAVSPALCLALLCHEPPVLCNAKRSVACAVRWSAMPVLRKASPGPATPLRVFLLFAALVQTTPVRSRAVRCSAVLCLCPAVRCFASLCQCVTVLCICCAMRRKAMRRAVTLLRCSALLCHSLRRLGSAWDCVALPTPCKTRRRQAVLRHAVAAHCLAHPRPCFAPRHRTPPFRCCGLLGFKSAP